MKTNKFSLSNYKLLTGDMGELIPVGLTEVLPGDTIQQATSALIRTNPLLAPVMHPVHVRIHHWFVPFRLLWNDWENFITGGPDGLNASTVPFITVNSGTGFAVGSLADYFGLPTGVDDISVAAMPFRGYSLIWNEFYRDADLQTALTIDLTDGVDTTTNTTLQSICWEKDYFTSARLTPQKGADVTLPLGTRANVLGIGVGTGATYNLSGAGFEQSDGTDLVGTAAANVDNTLTEVRIVGDNTSKTPNIYADLSTATAATVNELREAFALQRFQEARSRYGSRYTEYLRYLGVKSSDARLQRPEYLGGGKQTIQFSEVLQTGGTDAGASTGVGNLKGHGIGALRSNRYRRFFEEHGYVYTMLSVRPKTIYATGIPKMWQRTTKEDFFQKELQHIGQAEVYNREVYAADTSPNDVFGYQDRYDEYRRIESSIAGEFRTTLNFWHLARIFAADVTLNSAFVTCTPTERVFPVDSIDQLQIMVNHSTQARRMIGKQGTPAVF